MNKYKECVTTLPISPISNPGLGLVVVPFLSDVFSRQLGIENVFSLNVSGNKLNEKDTEENVSGYLSTLESLGVRANFTWRDDENYQIVKIEQIFDQLREDGLITNRKKLLNICDCGAVECLAEAENVSITRSLCYIKNEKRYCKVCNGEIREIENKVFLFNIPKLKNFGSISPSFYLKEIKELAEKFEGRNYLISRSRSSALTIKSFGEKISIDVDFAWQMFLPILYRCGYDTKILIGSNKNLIACYFSILMMELIEQKHIHLVIPPYFLAHEKKPLKGEMYCCRNILDKHDTKVLRLFLASALNWTKKESILEFNLLNILSRVFNRIESSKNETDINGIFDNLNDKRIKKIIAEVRRSDGIFIIKEFFGLI